MKLYGFANFAEQHLVPYEYAIILVYLYGNFKVIVWLL